MPFVKSRLSSPDFEAPCRPGSRLRNRRARPSFTHEARLPLFAERGLTLEVVAALNASGSRFLDGRDVPLVLGLLELDQRALHRVEHQGSIGANGAEIFLCP